MKEIFSYRSRIGTLCEYYNGDAFVFLYQNDEGEHTVPLYPLKREDAPEGAYYLGYTKEEIDASGRDLLAEAILAEGEPRYQSVKAVLPPLSTDTYAILGGPASVAGLTVDSDGVIYHQLSGDRDKTSFGALSSPIFSPAVYDARLGAIPPYQTILGGEYPLLLSVHTDGTDTLELLYFVEPTEPDRDPIAWIRAKRYRNAAPEAVTVDYRVAAIAREEGEEVLFNTPPTEEIFLDALLDTIAYWIDEAAEGAVFSLPEGELASIVHGTVAMAAVTATAGHMHYGHRFYGKELHDNFPPNYIFTIEAMIALGRHDRAREVFRHFIGYVLRGDGRINYRQGTHLSFGASAAEYGMLLHLAWRYRDILGTEALGHRERKRLCGMGEEILAAIAPCPECDGLMLVRTCAEADTNERIHAYLNNNLWAIRGLFALADLLGDNGARYREAAELLQKNVRTAIERHKAVGTRFGTLPPFRIGYPATPMTLSRCEDTFLPLEGDARRAYYSTLWVREDVEVFQDIAENSFANYRYYPEMLSSMLLLPEESDAIVRMREALGGELLCMTRLLNRIDDWPVAQYARFLLETERIDKYLLLLYAHAAHHGIPRLATYYEQVTADGAVKAFDCTPSLLTVPLLVSWAFAYEPIGGGALRLLSALPKEWIKKPFAATGIGYSGGRLSITSDGQTLRILFDTPIKEDAELYLRDRDTISPTAITEGAEHLKGIRGNIAVLGAGCRSVGIKL